MKLLRPIVLSVALIVSPLVASAASPPAAERVDGAHVLRVQHRSHELEQAREAVERARHRLRHDERNGAPHHVIREDRHELRSAEERLMHLERRFDHRR